MRAMLVAVVLAIGCGGCVAEPSAPAYSVKIGEPCDSDPVQLCNRTAGLCVDGACRSYCGLVTVPQTEPRCGAVAHEAHFPFDTNPDACVCVPD